MNFGQNVILFGTNHVPHQDTADPIETFGDEHQSAEDPH